MTDPLVTIPFWQRVPSFRSSGTSRWFGLTPPNSLQTDSCSFVGVVVVAGFFGLEALVVGLESLPQPAVRTVTATIRTTATP